MASKSLLLGADKYLYVRSGMGFEIEGISKVKFPVLTGFYQFLCENIAKELSNSYVNIIYEEEDENFEAFTSSVFISEVSSNTSVAVENLTTYVESISSKMDSVGSNYSPNFKLDVFWSRPSCSGVLDSVTPSDYPNVNVLNVVIKGNVSELVNSESLSSGKYYDLVDNFRLFPSALSSQILYEYEKANSETVKVIYPIHNDTMAFGITKTPYLCLKVVNMTDCDVNVVYSYRCGIDSESASQSMLSSMNLTVPSNDFGNRKVTSGVGLSFGQSMTVYGNLSLGFKLKS